MSDRERKEEEEEGPSLPSDSRRKKEEVLCGGGKRNEEKTEAEGKPKSAVFSSSPPKKSFGQGSWIPRWGFSPSRIPPPPDAKGGRDFLNGHGRNGAEGYLYLFCSCKGGKEKPM